MTPEIYGILFSWAVFLSPYSAETPPVMVEVPHEFFVEEVCGGKECNVLGWYNGHKIYIQEKLSGRLLDEMIVHEMVHYLQDLSMNYKDKSCKDSIIREREAYFVQGEYAIQATGNLPRHVNSHVSCKK